MVEHTDPAKEMSFAVAFIRVFSVFMFIIGIAEFIVSGIQLDASNNEEIGGIYFAATALLSGFWGVFMVEGVQQFNVLSLLLFMNLVASIVGVVYASFPIYILKRVKACAAFDPAGLDMPRCEDQFGSYSNFTCTGTSSYFIEAAKCASRYETDSTHVSNSCGCVYTDGGNHCKEFGGYSDCDEMQDSIAALSMGTYVLGYICLSMSFLLLISSCTASCMHKKRRGTLGNSADASSRSASQQQQRAGHAPAPGFFSASLRVLRITPAVPPMPMRQISVQPHPSNSPNNSPGKIAGAKKAAFHNKVGAEEVRSSETTASQP